MQGAWTPILPGSDEATILSNARVVVESQNFHYCPKVMRPPAPQTHTHGISRGYTESSEKAWLPSNSQGDISRDLVDSLNPCRHPAEQTPLSSPKY